MFKQLQQLYWEAGCFNSYNSCIGGLGVLTATTAVMEGGGGGREFNSYTVSYAGQFPAPAEGFGCFSPKGPTAIFCGMFRFFLYLVTKQFKISKMIVFVPFYYE